MIAAIASIYGCLVSDPFKLLLLIGGLILILIAMYGLLSYHITKNAIRKLSYIKDNTKGIDGIIYYPDRKTPYPQMIEEFKSTKTIYALWHMGGAAYNANLFHTGVLKKLLIIKPELNLQSPLKDYILRTQVGKKPEESIKNLKERIVVCRASKGEVYAINEVPPYLISISNPNEIDSWIKIEEFNLKVEQIERRSYVIFKELQPYLYEQIYRYFEYMWNHKKVTIE